MRKTLIALSAAALLMGSLTGCEKWSQRRQADGGAFGSYAGDWVVLKYNGGKITDVWILRNVIVQSEDHSDGWLFIDSEQNPVHIGGDMKAIRLNHRTSLRYVEYHMDQDVGLSYEEKFHKILPQG